jgi:DNA-binding IclR family transcriptional regulator
MQVLNFLAAHPTESFSLSHLVDQLGINVASLHAVLAALTNDGYVSRHARHRTYTLGPALVAVGAVALEQHPAIEAAREEAKRLGDRLELDVAVTARAGRDLAFVARTGMRHARGMSLYVGQRLQLRAPIGSIFYAWSDPATVDEWLAAVPEAERGHDREVLAAVARRGFSATVEVGPPAQPVRPTEHLVAIDPDASYDISTISGPVFDADGAVALTVNIVGVRAGLPGSEVLVLGDAVRDAALLVTKQTRGVIPGPLLIGPDADPALVDLRRRG